MKGVTVSQSDGTGVVEFACGPVGVWERGGGLSSVFFDYHILKSV